MSSKRKKLNILIKEHFNYDELKEEQYVIIKNILKKKDVCAILPTGFGKSMCYIMPYLYTKKCVVVVSPLIALMDDQVRQLKEKNIECCSLNSNNENKTENLHEIYEGKKMIIFTSPEYLAKNVDFIKNISKKKMLCCIAIDESHCVSNWGNDFRPDYQKLTCIKDINKNIPILALTATASEKVKNDICDILQLNEPEFITSNFDRPNLYISISEKTDDTIDKMIELINKYPNDRIIIYCKTKDTTDKINDTINKYGIPSVAYHAGKNGKTRTECQNEFTQNKIKCVVATIAFGLGINIPNIRVVIHYNCPSDIESYYQEIGRAGRDNKDSECFLFYSSQDFAISNYFTKEIKNEEFKKHKENEIKLMQKFVYTNICRRNILLKHFDNNLNITSCNKCDVCCSKSETLNNFTKESLLMLKIIMTLNSSFGATTYIKLLRGSKEKRLKDFIFRIPYLYGKGYKIEEHVWKQIINQLVSQDYLENKNIKGNKFGSILSITTKGRSYIENHKTDIMLNIKKTVELSDCTSNYSNDSKNSKNSKNSNNNMNININECNDTNSFYNKKING
jgi:RecQ family ATP-dependent DNA helicase